MTTHAPISKTIYAFPEPTFIENIAIRPNGHLLLTTFREGSVYDIDPFAASPEPQLVTKLPKTTALTGIVEIEPDVFAITGGTKAGSFRFEEGSMKAFVLDLRSGIELATIGKPISVEAASLLNGMAGVPENPHIMLSLESFRGQIYRIDTNTGAVDVVLQHSLLMPSEKARKVPLGANGAKVRDGHIYFINPSQEVFCRVKIDGAGSVIGDVEIVAQNEGADRDMPYDDFDFDSAGNAWITVHPDCIYRISPEGQQTLHVGGHEPGLQEPTSLTVSKDGTKLYVACAGKMGEWYGSVVEVPLP